MKNSALFLCLCLFVLGPSASWAQASASNQPGFDKIPSVIFEGLHQLDNQNPVEAERAWFRWRLAAGGAIPSDLPDFLAQNNFGAYQSFDVISTQDLTPRMRILYLTLNFDKQPLIVKFVLYRTSDGWVPTYHKVGIDEAILETVPQARQ